MKAVYALVLELEETREIDIGALGDIEFAPGMYVYVGSAMNSVEKRLGRHFSETGNRHWHIDYFSAVAKPVDYLVLPEDSEFECVLSGIMAGIGTAVPGFGCSDCSCGSHLFRVE